jgi:exosome complex RNA-binding protein Rrp42 (RNase PH superfamily)
MASSGKKKTTMAKLAREGRLRERRLEKKARKDARKLAPATELEASDDTLDGTEDDVAVELDDVEVAQAAAG